MLNLTETRISLLYAYDSSIINDEEFVLLYDINTAKSPDFPYWNYEAFQLDSMSGDECQVEFHFYKNNVYDLMEDLGCLETFTCYNGLTVDGTEALCIFLKRFAYPCRYLDMILRFARPMPQLCMTSNIVMDYLYTHWSHLLTSLDQPWLSLDNLKTFANATFQFQSVAVPNRLVANLYGPVEGKRHDSSMLAESSLCNQLVLYSRVTNGDPLCLYGDPAYPHRSF